MSYTLPAGWEGEGVFVAKSDSDTMVFLTFFDVAKIYTDGCKWQVVEPPIGPTVDDLVTAYAKLPGVGGAARDVTVDGFTGKEIDYTVPDYNEDKCRERRFGIFQEDHFSDISDQPNLWAQAPKERQTIKIIDVDGTRLVILSAYPPNTSARDRADQNKILDSIQIG